MALRESDCFLVRRVADRGINKNNSDSRACGRNNIPNYRFAGRGSGRDVFSSQGCEVQETDPRSVIWDGDRRKEGHLEADNEIYPTPPCFDVYPGDKVSKEDLDWVMKALNGYGCGAAEGIMGLSGKLLSRETMEYSKAPAMIRDECLRESSVVMNGGHTVVRDGDERGSQKFMEKFMEIVTKFPNFGMMSTESTEILGNFDHFNNEIGDKNAWNFVSINIEFSGDAAVENQGARYDKLGPCVFILLLLFNYKQWVPKSLFVIHYSLVYRCLKFPGSPSMNQIVNPGLEEDQWDPGGKNVELQQIWFGSDFESNQDGSGRVYRVIKRRVRLHQGCGRVFYVEHWCCTTHQSEGCLAVPQLQNTTSVNCEMPEVACMPTGVWFDFQIERMVLTATICSPSWGRNLTPNMDVGLEGPTNKLVMEEILNFESISIKGLKFMHKKQTRGPSTNKGLHVNKGGDHVGDSPNMYIDKSLLKWINELRAILKGVNIGNFGGSYTIGLYNIWGCMETRVVDRLLPRTQFGTFPKVNCNFLWQKITTKGLSIKLITRTCDSHFVVGVDVIVFEQVKTVVTKKQPGVPLDLGGFSTNAKLEDEFFPKMGRMMQWAQGYT